MNKLRSACHRVIQQVVLSVSLKIKKNCLAQNSSSDHWLTPSSHKNPKKSYTNLNTKYQHDFVHFQPNAHQRHEWLPPLLTWLVRGPRLDCIWRIRSIKPETFTCISKLIYDCKEFNGMTLLHACILFNPPVSVLQKMIELHPQALRREDYIRRTPPHIAAGSTFQKRRTTHLRVHRSWKGFVILMLSTW